MSPTPLTAALLAAIAVSTALLGELAALAAVALVVAVVVDARAVRRAPERGARRAAARCRAACPAALVAPSARADGARVRVRQAAPPDLDADAARGGRRGSRRRSSPAGAAATSCRRSGPAASGRCGWRAGTTAPGEPAEVSVYPDLASARRLALSVRRGQFREQGVSARGPLGLGTDFELVRDYLPDDDVRQVNWRATARLGRPMSNQYRVEQDRDLVLLLDAGRLAAAALPVAAAEARPRGTVLDATLDALAAVALVADAVGDRCGAIAFDREVRGGAAPAARGRRRRRARAARPRSRGSSTPTTRRRSAASRGPSARSC